MRRFKVLQVLPDLAPYGAERVAANLALSLDRRRFETAVVSLFGELRDSLAGPLSDSGLRVFHLNKRRGLDPRMFVRFARLLHRERPDVVHTHNYVLRYTLPPSLRHKVPVLVHTVHNVADREVDRIGAWLQSWAFRRRVHAVSIAEKVSESYERFYSLPRPPLIPNGIELGRYTQAAAGRADWRRRQGFQRDDLLFACVARFSPQKNHQSLMSAFAAGPGCVPKAKLVLAGDGGLQTELERQAERLKIADRVYFLGRRADVPDLLGAVDFFVLASLWEGNPLSVMEAMAAGLPVIVPAVGGIPELVQHGRTGFLVPPGDTAALASALRSAVNDPAVFLRLGEAAARHARDKFDLRSMVCAYEEFYEKLLRAGALEGNHATCHA